MRNASFRLVSMILTAVLLASAACPALASEEPTGEPSAEIAEAAEAAEAAETAGEAEEPAEAAPEEPAYDGEGGTELPTIPENEAYTIHSDGADEAAAFRFVPSATTAYSIFLEAENIDVPVESQSWYVSVNAVFDDGHENQIVSAYAGPGSSQYQTGDTLRYVPMAAGTAYKISFWLDTPGDFTVRVISFADQTAAAERAGAPLLTEDAGAHVEYDGTYMSGVARFVAPAAGTYRFTTGSGMYKVIVGEEGVYFSDGHPSDSSVEAALFPGRTYLVFLYGAGGAPVSADVKVSRAAERSFAPVTYRAEDLAAGPLRYTVLILQDNYVVEDTVVDEEREAAARLCEALAAAPGTSYVAVVDMYDQNVIFPGGYGYDPWSRTDTFFGSDTGVLRERIGVIDGSSRSGADLAEALYYAGGLLDAARAAYGDSIETNIVLCSATDLKTGARQSVGMYNSDPRSNGVWAFDACLNACRWRAEYEKAKGHGIYSVSFSSRGFVSFGEFRPLDETENSYLCDFMRDISSGDGYYFDIRDAVDMAPAMDEIAGSIIGAKPVMPLTAPGPVWASGLIPAGQTYSVAELLRRLVGLTQ